MRKIAFAAFIFLPYLTFSQSKLKSIYSEDPKIFETSKSFDEVWRIIIDYFSAKGISIQTIDKTSGIITSTGFSFLKDNPRNERKGKSEPGALYTYEDYKTKQPINRHAWIVINRLADAKIYPVKLTGNINVTVRDLSEKTTVTVHLSNLYGESSNSRDKWKYYQVKSTGVFENLILGIIK